MDPFLNLTVKSTSGSFQDRWNRNNKAERVLKDAIRHLDLNPSAGYRLVRERTGEQLDLGEKLADLGIEDGETLIVQVEQAQDG